jgi:uncharacterized protein (UPF0297 family)
MSVELVLIMAICLLMIANIMKENKDNIIMQEINCDYDNLKTVFDEIKNNKTQLDDYNMKIYKYVKNDTYNNYNDLIYYLLINDDLYRIGLYNTKIKNMLCWVLKEPF